MKLWAVELSARFYADIEAETEQEAIDLAWEDFYSYGASESFVEDVYELEDDDDYEDEE